MIGTVVGKLECLVAQPHEHTLVKRLRRERSVDVAVAPESAQQNLRICVCNVLDWGFLVVIEESGAADVIVVRVAIDKLAHRLIRDVADGIE